MKTLLITLSISVALLLCSPSQATAQELSSKVSQQAEQLSRSLSTSDNLPVRFHLLANQVKSLDSREEVNQWLAFFSDSRVLFWNSPASEPAQKAMAQLETTAKEFASQRGFYLDLPPVGFSPTVTGGGPLALPQDPTYTHQGLINSAVVAERVATQVLQSHAGDQDLQRLHSSLEQVRSQLVAGTPQPETVAEFLKARAEYLMARPAGANQEQLNLQLDMLVSALRQNPVWDRATGDAYSKRGDLLEDRLSAGD